MKRLFIVVWVLQIIWIIANFMVGAIQPYALGSWVVLTVWLGAMTWPKPR